MASTPRITDIEKTVFGNKVKTDFISAPYTTIKNEQGDARTIPDLENNLKASMGVERVMFNSIKKLDKEFGPAGEQVHELGTKDTRVRFVGEWDYTANTEGGYAQNTSIKDSDFIEITFYGTGLNLLSHRDSNSGDLRVTVDGGAESGNVYVNTFSVLSVRNYKTNVVFPIVSGLSLGLHTVKLRQGTSGTVNSIDSYGVEILNENASAQLTINAGEPFVGGEAATLDTQQIIDAGPAAYTGTKGARVVTYLDEEGNIGQAITETDPSVTTGNPTELVTNGDFGTGLLTPWVDVSTAGGSATVVSNELVISKSGVALQYGRGEQSITTVIGQKYTLTFDLISHSGDTSAFSLPAVTIQDSVDTAIASLVVNDFSTGSKSLTFTATDTTTTIFVAHSGSGSGSQSATTVYDNFSVKETSYDFLALGDTDHSEEEIIRTINYKEFGANRADDFSTIPTDGVGTDRAFTLDDGTTTLVGDNVYRWSGITDDNVYMANTGHSMTLTFVGTGLDLIISTSPASGDSIEVTVDGTVITSTFTPDTNLDKQILKVCSGLPYGTHTVKFKRVVVVGAAFGTHDFLIYGPKKPVLPDNTFELSDYNIVADYQIGTEGLETISSGVIRKDSSRENIYKGTNWVVATAQMAYIGGTQLAETGAPSSSRSCEYTFYGTGIEIRHSSFAAYNTDMRFFLDGVSLTSANFPTAVFSDYGYDNGYNSTTGSLDMSSASNQLGCGFSISNLPLGVHTIKFDKSGASGGTMSIDAWDVITPIHINNTKVGSLSLEDKREDQQRETDGKSIDMTKAKAWLVYDMTTNEILESFNIASVLDVATGNNRIYFKKPFKSENYVACGLALNGTGKHLNTDNLKPSYTYLYRMSDGGTLEDGKYSIIFFGELQDEENIDFDSL